MQFKVQPDYEVEFCWRVFPSGPVMCDKFSVRVFPSFLSLFHIETEKGFGRNGAEI